MNARFYIGLMLIFAATSLQAQQGIPNGSFESWTAGNPDGWVTPNVEGFVAPITQSSTAIDGQSSLRGEVMSIFGQPLPPLAGTGRMINDEDPILGFPFTERPQALNGYISTNLNGLDTATIIVAFKKDGDSIGVGVFRTGNDIPNLTAFSAPIYWFDSRSPDTAYVLMVIEGEPVPTIGSTFNFDALTFGPAASVEQRVSDGGFKVAALSGGGYEFQIENSGLEHSRIDILDIYGRVVETVLDDEILHTRIRWHGTALSTGMYMARLTTPDGVGFDKLLLTR